MLVREVAFGDVIGHWLLVIGGSVAEQRYPKPFTIHHSLFTPIMGRNA